ncbi:MAG: TraB/GumN family protein [Cyclobacteriaceae bacterium]|nr:TraB/GumN family protein [Cyclobacteriaceae bacterium]MCH8516988.1 TraB/GumN family protein [Cyclobacteriaceae bacterium]
MRLITLLAILLFLSSSTVNASNQLFWQITGKGVNAKVYLYATHPLVGYREMLDDKMAMQIFNQSDLFIGEHDQSTLAMQAIAPKLMMQQNALSNFLNTANYNLTDHLLKKYTGLGIVFYKNLYPRVVHEILRAAFWNELTGTNLPMLTESMDIHLQNEARKMQKEIQYIYGIDDYITTFTNKPSSDIQGAHLNRFIEDVEYKKTLILREYDCWEDKDEECLTEMYFESMMIEEDLYQILIPEISDYIHQKIKTVFGDKKVIFIALPVHYMGGDEGLIKALRQRGYTVEKN